MGAQRRRGRVRGGVRGRHVRTLLTPKRHPFSLADRRTAPCPEVPHRVPGIARARHARRSRRRSCGVVRSLRAHAAQRARSAARRTVADPNFPLRHLSALSQAPGRGARAGARTALRANGRAPPSPLTVPAERPRGERGPAPGRGLELGGALGATKRARPKTAPRRAPLPLRAPRLRPRRAWWAAARVSSRGGVWWALPASGRAGGRRARCLSKRAPLTWRPMRRQRGDRRRS